MTFSLVYWAAGGTGRCYCDPITTTAIMSTTTEMTASSFETSTTTTTMSDYTTTVPCVDTCDKVNSKSVIVIKSINKSNLFSLYTPFLTGKITQGWQ